MSYQHGKAPADAPVTWRKRDDSDAYTVWRGIDIAYELCAVTHNDEDADDLCRAFHLAKLAGEAKDMVKAYPLPIHRNDWLRRYDAAKGEA